MRNSFSYGPLNQKGLFETDQEMSKLPRKIKKKLDQEASYWDTQIARENAAQLNNLLEEAEPFMAQRPARQPVSLRIDPFDLSMAKRIARLKGIPFSQLMALWLHERIEQEKAQV
jgi:hypothetical protein